jgi:penicillin amidase
MKPKRRCGKTTSISGLAFMGLLFSLVLFGCADSDHDSLTTTTTTIVIPGTTTTTVPAEALQTVRGDKGVWFIEGPADAALFDVYAQMGHAVAHDRLWQMETYRRAAAGRLSEIFGESQLETDIFMRIIGYSEAELSAGFAALDAEAKQVVEGYVAGVNRAVEAIRNNVLSIPFEFAALDILPEYWRPEEVLAVVAFFLRRFDPEALESRQLDNLRLFQALNARFGDAAPAMFADLRRRNDPDAQT